MGSKPTNSIRNDSIQSGATTSANFSRKTIQMHYALGTKQETRKSTSRKAVAEQRSSHHATTVRTHNSPKKDTAGVSSMSWPETTMPTSCTETMVSLVMLIDPFAVRRVVVRRDTLTVPYSSGDNATLFIICKDAPESA